MGPGSDQPMQRRCLPKSSLLRKPDQYQRVYRTGRRIRSRHFSLIIAPNNGPKDRLGISLYGFKSAVLRNRKKRIIREFFRLNHELLHQAVVGDGGHVDIIFAVRHQLQLDSPAAIGQAVRALGAATGSINRTP